MDALSSRSTWSPSRARTTTLPIDFAPPDASRANASCSAVPTSTPALPPAVPVRRNRSSGEKIRFVSGLSDGKFSAVEMGTLSERASHTATHQLPC